MNSNGKSLKNRVSNLKGTFFQKIDADEDGRRRRTTCRLEEALRRKTIEEGRASAAGKKNYPDGECPAGRSVVGIHFAVLLTRFAWKEKSSEIFLF